MSYDFVCVDWWISNLVPRILSAPSAPMWSQCLQSFSPSRNFRFYHVIPLVVPRTICSRHFEFARPSCSSPLAKGPGDKVVALVVFGLKLRLKAVFFWFVSHIVLQKETEVPKTTTIKIHYKENESLQPLVSTPLYAFIKQQKHNYEDTTNTLIGYSRIVFPGIRIILCPLTVLWFKKFYNVKLCLICHLDALGIYLCTLPFVWNDEMNIERRVSLVRRIRFVRVCGSFKCTT